jgi:hypothetical protein
MICKLSHYGSSSLHPISALIVELQTQPFVRVEEIVPSWKEIDSI